MKKTAHEKWVAKSAKVHAELTAISRKIRRLGATSTELISEIVGLENRAEKWEKSSDHYEHQARYLRAQLSAAERRERENKESVEYWKARLINVKKENSTLHRRTRFLQHQVDSLRGRLVDCETLHDHDSIVRWEE
jgi:chromosome segregation ATPase